MGKGRARSLSLAAWAAAGLLEGCANLTDGKQPKPPPAYESGIGPIRSSDWANLSANAMVEKYGPPTRIESKRMVWENRGPWKRISVWDKLDFHQTLHAAHNLENTIAYYPVPQDKREALRAFDARVTVSEDGTELSAFSFDEEYNYLALNLADEIIRGARTVPEANEFYAATVRLSMAGRASPYMRRLLFSRPPLPQVP